MDVLYAGGEATATQVLGALPDPPTRTAVRTLLAILERKGHVEHRKAGREFVYRPKQPRKQAARRAFRRVLHIFFQGSLEQAVAAHLADPRASLDADELKRLSALIEQAKHKGNEHGGI